MQVKINYLILFKLISFFSIQSTKSGPVSMEPPRTAPESSVLGSQWCQVSKDIIFT